MPEPIHAPELDGATAWLNTTALLTIRALRGKVVLLDFWTYGCVNCMHVLPDLKRLEAKYADELVVIGIHSPCGCWTSRGVSFPYAGNGQEARIDGSIDDAGFAQPSGLDCDGGALYVADAEANIIRRIKLPPLNQVDTLAGGNLFDFGDRDGSGDEVRLQHPLAVAWRDGRVFIADTYNHRIKGLDPTG